MPLAFAAPSGMAASTVAYAVFTCATAKACWAGVPNWRNSKGPTAIAPTGAFRAAAAIAASTDAPVCTSPLKAYRS